MEWISIKDRLPKQNTEIIANTKTKGVKMGKYIAYKIPTIYANNKEMQFTHWMPKPEATQQKAQEHLAQN